MKSENPGTQTRVVEQIMTGLVKNRPGVLAVIAEKFRDMNINISSIAVAEMENEDTSYITIVTEATDLDMAKIQEKLTSIIEIRKIETLGEGDHYERELVLVKVALESAQMSQIMQISEVFRAHVVGVSTDTITLEFAGRTEEVKGFINMLRPFGIKGLARTGRTALKKDG